MFQQWIINSLETKKRKSKQVNRSNKEESNGKYRIFKNHKKRNKNLPNGSIMESKWLTKESVHLRILSNI